MFESTTTPELPVHERSRFFWLRFAVSVFFGLLTVALVALWVRSHRVSDSFFGPLIGSYGLSLDSVHGGVVTYLHSDTPYDGWGQWTEYPPHFPGGPWDDYDEQVGAWDWLPMGRTTADALVIPRFALVGLSGMIAVAVWCRFSFSLRTLLVATTAVAVTLGLAVCAVR